MDEQTARAPGADLVVNTLRRRFALILVCALLGVAAGWFYGESQPSSYTSSSSVLVNPADGNPYSPSGLADDLISLETEALIVTSDAVLQLVAEEAAGDRTPAELEARVQVVVPANTQILQISYRAADPEVARDTAQAFATAYLDNRLQRAEDVSAAQMAVVESQTEKVLEDLRTATEASQTGSRADRAFQAELASALNSELVNLRAQLGALENTSVQPGRIISPAGLPGDGGLMQLVFPVAGGLAGLFLGFLLGLLLERKRGRAWSPHDVEVTGLPVLANLSTGSPVRRSRVSNSERFNEAIRRVRAAVLDADMRRGIIAVASCSGRGVEPGIADALAVSLARTRHDVILVDADRRIAGRSAVPDGHPGLTDLLSGKHSDVRTVLVPDEERGIRVLPRGEVAPEDSDSFVKERLVSSLEPLLTECDFLVLRAPSLHSTQGEALAAAADLTIAVVTVGGTRRSELVGVVQRAYDSQTAFLGAFLIPRRRGIPPFRSRSGGGAKSTRGKKQRQVDEEPAHSLPS